MTINANLLYAMEDEERAFQVIAKLEEVLKSARRPAHRIHIFFASEYSVVPGHLMNSFHQVRMINGTIIVALDSVGHSAMQAWNEMGLIDAQAGSLASIAAKIVACWDKSSTATDIQTESAQPIFPSVFISYSSHDASFKNELTVFLRRRRWQWWDYDESKRNYQLGISRELAECITASAVVIFLITPSWVASSWCVREYDFTLSKNIESLCLLIRKADLSVIKNNLSSPERPYIDFTKDADSGFERLGKTLDEIWKRKASFDT